MSLDVPVSSGQLATDTQIAPTSRNGLVTYLEVHGNGGAGGARIHSGSDASGTMLAEASAADGATNHVAFPKGVAFHGGLWLDVDATTLAIVHYL